MAQLLKVKTNLKLGPNTKAIMSDTSAMFKIMESLRADLALVLAVSPDKLDTKSAKQKLALLDKHEERAKQIVAQAKVYMSS